MKLFNLFIINTNFIIIHPLSWWNNDNYKMDAAIIKKITVVNYVAERGIILIEKYTDKIT